MFEKLQEINSRPAPFEFYTAEELWADEHTSKKMLEYHLNESIDLSSRKKDFIDRSVKWIVSRFELDGTKSVVDFGCGPGLYTTQFAETKADVSGIDFSGRSIEYARKISGQKGLNIKYYQQNYLEYDSDKKFDLITMIFCDFCALSPAQRKTLLGKFHKFLKPGGSVLLDVHSLNIFNSRKEAAVYEFNQLDHFWAEDDYYAFLNTIKYDTEKVTLDKYTIIEKNRKRIVYNWLQYYSKDSLQQEFEKNGFEAKEFYSNVAGEPFSPDSPDFAIVARQN
jgi:SAM-dependent methyltransferase